MGTGLAVKLNLHGVPQGGVGLEAPHQPLRALREPPVARVRHKLTLHKQLAYMMRLFLIRLLMPSTVLMRGSVLMKTVKSLKGFERRGAGRFVTAREQAQPCTEGAGAGVHARCLGFSGYSYRVREQVRMPGTPRCSGARGGRA